MKIDYRNKDGESIFVNGKQSQWFPFPKLMTSFLLFLTFLYFFYSTVSMIFFTTPTCKPISTTESISTTSNLTSPPPSTSPTTTLHHIVFGIAASAKLWTHRRDYIKLWYRPDQMRGFVWLDKFPAVNESSRNQLHLLPPLKISAGTKKFPYTNKKGHRSAIRISRIVSETFRLGLPDVRWFVMGDDDTVFVPDNLLRVLSRLDHTQPYYIGSSSESHIQNIHFSYSMAYGGGGFAISEPLARSLSKMQDSCLTRYPALYGSDDRIQACMAELGVPLTRHPGFHQYDVYGDLLGLLSAHPVAPLVSLHHLDVVQPIFPGLSRSAAVKRLFDTSVGLDSAGVTQQSICYERKMRWTVSVSWGFSVQVIRGVMSQREMEMPARTFLNWYKRADYTAFPFNTRPVARNPCQKPYLFYLSSGRPDRKLNTTITQYGKYKELKQAACRWKLPDPDELLDRIVVYKKPDPGLWDRSPRRNCCRIQPYVHGRKKLAIEVGVCRAGEVSEP